MHFLAVVPEAYESHRVVQRLRRRAKVGYDLAGAGSAVGLDVDGYAVHGNKRKRENVKRNVSIKPDCTPSLRLTFLK